MVFRDDECRLRTDHAPANFTTLKHMALNLRDRPELGGMGVLIYRYSPNRDGWRGWSCGDLIQLRRAYRPFWRPEPPHSTAPFRRKIAHQYTHTPKFWTVPYRYSAGRRFKEARCVLFDHESIRRA